MGEIDLTAGQMAELERLKALVEADDLYGVLDVDIEADEEIAPVTFETSGCQGDCSDCLGQIDPELLLQHVAGGDRVWIAGECQLDQGVKRSLLQRLQVSRDNHRGIAAHPLKELGRIARLGTGSKGQSTN